MDYKKRIADEELAFRLECSGAVLIEGPKWCGKTRTAEQHAKSIIRLQDTDKNIAYKQTASVKPSLLLNGLNPRLIDEWQEIPVYGILSDFLLTAKIKLDFTFLQVQTPLIKIK